MNNFLQLSATGTSLQGGESKLSDLKTKIAQKKYQVLQIVQDFRKINSNLSNIKEEFHTKGGQDMELSLLKSQEEDTQLSKVFEQESKQI